MSAPAPAGPDFVIVGAMKCGTSTLAAQLGAQDGIFVTEPKEPNFFSDDPVWAQGADWYATLFAPARPGDLRGEASTHYTKLPTHPRTIERMRSLGIGPKIVYAIRDPVVRAVSHYIHGWSRDEITGDLSAALERHPELVSYGCYGMQIAPFIEAFGSENVLLTSLEAMKADPGAEFSRIGTFLGRGDVTWRDDLGTRNASAERARKLPFHGLLVDNPVAASLRRRLVPKSFRTRIRRARTMQDRPVLTEAQRRGLEAQFLEDRQTLSRLFPGHSALDLCYPFAP